LPGGQKSLHVVLEPLGVEVFRRLRRSASQPSEPSLLRGSGRNGKIESGEHTVAELGCRTQLGEPPKLGIEKLPGFQL
jgi:hypothetical protein